MARSVMAYLNKAALYSVSKNNIDRRHYLLGAIGIRCDGVEVHARNESNYFIDRHNHAEYRLMRKSTPGTIVYVARITRSLQWANAKPCSKCMKAMRDKGIKKIFYTISPNEYGVINI